MPFVKSNPNEYLVMGRKGKITNLGHAASAYLWPGSSFVFVPSTQQKTIFEMTQESSDGIPLRFKGIVIFRITDPIIVANRFDFVGNQGMEDIRIMISHVCLGELRAKVSHMTMKECIEQRKTTLTDTVATTVRNMVQGSEGRVGWGIEVDVVQVAQVFIVDDELRRQLEVEVRNQIKANSELSDIQMEESLKLARISSARRIEQESLENERQALKIRQEKQRLNRDFAYEQLEAETPLRLAQIEKDKEVLQQQLTHRQVQLEDKKLEIELNLLEKKAVQDLHKDILPLEQMPQITESLSKIFQGANLSIYGENVPLLASLQSLLELVTQSIKNATGTRLTSE